MAVKGRRARGRAKGAAGLGRAVSVGWLCPLRPYVFTDIMVWFVRMSPKRFGVWPEPSSLFILGNVDVCVNCTHTFEMVRGKNTAVPAVLPFSSVRFSKCLDDITCPVCHLDLILLFLAGIWCLYLGLVKRGVAITEVPDCHESDLISSFCSSLSFL